MGFLGDLFGGAAEKQAADKNRALYNSYNTQGQGFLQTGYDTAQGNLNNALGAYTPLADLAKQFGGGTNLYLDALGVNGAGGNARASSAFTTSPGYQQGIDAGIDVLNRRRASAGMLNSGNADQDAQTFGQNAQNQQWNGWLDRLNGVNANNIATTGAVASGQAGVYGGMADLARGNASDQIGLLGNTTSGLASANNLQAQGQAAGAKNLLGAGLSLASLAAGGMGGGGLGSMFSGGGGMGSALGSMGVTYGSPGTRFSNLYGPVA